MLRLAMVSRDAVAGPIHTTSHLTYCHATGGQLAVLGDDTGKR
ncbi:hypothetical protein AF72_03490 [Xylella taiwanensis]|uniref:Uncharacterized protein n=1 Tax=Xylella taiwanensis TaxID=1444770 RepID=Z9JM92_9GAMM|nr:hypothetical protein AF72_03490 [Xylella taiwanensis]